jgi:phage shock protein E
MDWVPIVIVGGVFAALLGLKQLGLVSAEKARVFLRQGARVIDVRSIEEFQASHLEGAVNIPLGELREQIARHAPNKNQPLLLHCLSGGRSGLARRTLRQMGYSNAHNLGSYGRAGKILKSLDG